MLRRLLPAALLAAGIFAPSALAAPAPGAPGAKATWAPADKHGFGTARGAAAGPVWFTLRQASLSEVYYPDLGTPSLRGLQFAVTDGRTFVDRETVDDDPNHIEPVAPGVRAHVEPVPGSLTFRQVTETSRWRLTKTWVTDPDRATVLASVHFESRTGRPLQLYVLGDPAPGDDGNDDRASGLTAWDDAGATALDARPSLRDATAGYKGTASDPWQELSRAHRLTTYSATAPGNVVDAARTALTGVGHDTDMTLAIGFGADPRAAAGTAAASLRTGFGSASRRYAAGWTAYLRSLKAPPASVSHDVRLYQQSLMVLAASEDKHNPGATVAAPNMPWIWGTLKLNAPGDDTSGPYHLVWPRDLYHVVTALKAAGDEAAAARAVDHLWAIQLPDGSWSQNTEPDGTPHWTGQQLDEDALPIVLAWWLGRRGAGDWPHIRAAADYIRANGPRTGQERWENQDGYSPNTIATEIAGLVCAADVARANGDTARADAYDATADDWQAKVQGWTATDNGPYSPRPYYVRVTKDGQPDNATTYNLGDNHATPVDQREIVDNSFLGLVLFGVKPFDDPVVKNSLAVGDAQLRADTPAGPVWHRFTFDGYGETSSGGDWDLFPTSENQTHGGAWPLLTGERGEYELLAGQSAAPYLDTIARTANDGLMLPEQVDPATGAGTRSATPLAWTHAEFIRLAWSIQAGAPIETPSIVARRYG
jgi:glucoamylase